MRYKWEAYRDTNGRRTDSISLSLETRGTKSVAIPNWEAYCDTNGRCIAILF